MVCSLSNLKCNYVLALAACQLQPDWTHQCKQCFLPKSEYFISERSYLSQPRHIYHCDRVKEMLSQIPYKKLKLYIKTASRILLCATCDGGSSGMCLMYQCKVAASYSIY